MLPQFIHKIYTSDQLSGTCMAVEHFTPPYPCEQESIKKRFQNRMGDVGYIRHQAFTTWVAETLYTHAFANNPQMLEKCGKVFSGSSLDTFRRMSISHAFVYSPMPTVGAIAFWQLGHTWLGQAAIVLQVMPHHKILTIEGHNVSGQEDGFFVKRRTRKTDAAHQTHGLNLQGFITPHPAYL